MLKDNNLSTLSQVWMHCEGLDTSSELQEALIWNECRTQKDHSTPRLCNGGNHRRDIVFRLRSYRGCIFEHGFLTAHLIVELIVFVGVSIALVISARGLIHL